MKNIYSLLMAFFCTLCYSQDIEIQSFATGLDKPVNMKHAGDSRLFVVEQDGFIRIVNSDGSVNATPFLDIDNLVTDLGGIGDERGLLGLAFHPDYATNGYFYVYYTDINADTVVSRFSRSAANPDLADPNSELILLTYDQPYGNHNGGGLDFGIDGYLYISSGDGGAANDPGNRAQMLTTLLGKLLRIDVDNTSNGNNYAIPSDNPFFGSTTAMQEIWAYGLRNPWKFSFDRTTNELWIADVGQNVYEEIDMVSATAAGLNYGWRCYEANSDFNVSSTCPEPSALIFPIGVYSHSGGRCSITGGYRYRGTANPTLAGIYFFGDYCSSEIGMLQQSGGNWNMTFSQAYPGNNWSTFGEDVNGELYVAGVASGTIYKIVQSTLSIDENHLFDFQMYPNPATDVFTVDFSNGSLSMQSIEIYSIQGERVKSITNFESQSPEISTKNFANGVYFVKATTQDGAQNIKKLIIN